MNKGIKISSVVLTYNEEENIARCLESLKDVADEMIVVDSFSTDDTEKICRQYGVKFIQHEYVSHIEQKQYAISLAGKDYVLLLDADECLSRELKEVILKLKKDPTADAYVINRFNKYCDRWIRYSGYYPDKKIRFWKKGMASIKGTNPHEQVVAEPGASVKRIKQNILHFPYDTVDEHLIHVMKYATISAQAKYKEGEKANFVAKALLNPMWKFFRKYIIQLGFLDGYYGFVFCAIESSMNFFKYLKLYEYNKKGLPGEKNYFVN